ncbi:MAG: TonB-dependent receptor [Smithella sp.]
MVTDIGKWFLFYVFMLVLIFSFQDVLAQEEKEQKKNKQNLYNLEEIPVTDRRAAEPVTSPYAVTESSKLQTEVWTKEEIEALHPETVWDVLEQVPGMEVTFQGRQHLNFSNVRGTGNYRVILDGVYVSSIDRIASTLPVDAIESMTIVRDATALTLGPLTNFGAGTGSSNQGFVIIKTKRSSKLEGGFVGSYGTFNTEKEHVYQGAKIGNFDYRIAATNNRTEGRDDWYNASDNKSILFRGGYATKAFYGDMLFYNSRGMREFQRGEYLIRTVKTRAVTTGPIANRRPATYYEVGELDNSKWKIDPMDATMFAVNLNKPWSDTQTTSFNYAYNSLQVHTVQGSFANSTVSYSDQDSREQSVSLRHVINSHGHVFKLGGQYFNYVCPDGLAPNTGKRVDESMYSLFVQDEYHLLNNRMTIDAGIRLDKKHFNNSPVTGAAVDEWAKETWTGALGAAYKLTDIFTITGRYAYAENSLSSNQVSSDGSSLPPEKQSRFEAGILANIHPFFNPWITGYYYDTKDQKVSTTGTDPNTGATVSSYIDPITGEEVDFVTAANVITKGVEAGISGNIFKPFTYRLQYTYVTTNDASTNDSIAHHLVSATVGCKYKNAFANLSYRYVGPHDRNSSPNGTVYYELGDYSRLDANVGYNFKIFNRDTRVTVYGKNLGNKHYATRYVTGAYKDPGFQIGAELALSFF